MRSHKNHLDGRVLMVLRLALAALRSGAGLDGLWLWRRHARDGAGGWSSRTYALSNLRPMDTERRVVEEELSGERFH